MPPFFTFKIKPIAACGIALATLSAFATVPAMSAEKVLYSFKGGSDGAGPFAGVTADATGDIYGTTASGGDGGAGCRNGGGSCGTVFELAAEGAETVLHAFVGGCDDAFPSAGLIADNAGNFYGTTEDGGDCKSNEGNGTIFKIASDGTESVFYSFPGGSGGENPDGIVADKNGNLYGTANGGDSINCDGGCGVVFEVTPAGKEKFVYSFQAGNDGDGPSGPVILDKAGNIYGTTVAGGGSGCNDGGGCDTIFKIAPDGTESVLYAFQGGDDGDGPQNGVIEDSAGNLYGATGGGGAGDAGTVFKVTPTGTETVLYSFRQAAGGFFPESGLIMDKAGNIYGTTYYGGGTGCKGTGCGVVFELAPDGAETVLYAFKRRDLGQFPAAPLLLGKHNDLYGTTTAGGKSNDGVVFRVTTK